MYKRKTGLLRRRRRIYDYVETDDRQVSEGQCK